ncbi:MAG: GIY-YIG nuclease family protein [Gammaproteobacteria bacterium]|nr:GIY-YIG nuclease family protein [Gammaproteobacteria bacterium]
MARRNDIDWEAIEKDYSAGLMSIMAVAVKHGVSNSQVRVRAAHHEWPRNKSDQVRIGKTRAVPASIAVDQRGRATQSSCGFIYVCYVDAGDERIYKIGLAKNPVQRMAQHQCSSPLEIMVACCYFTSNMQAEEKALHEAFAAKRVRGEWFALDDDDLIAISARSRLV